MAERNFTDWSGGDRPVSGETRVYVRFRGPMTPEQFMPFTPAPYLAQSLRWHWDEFETECDITGYEIAD